MRASAISAVLALALGCSVPTRLVVIVDSDYAIPDPLGQVRMTVGRLGGTSVPEQVPFDLYGRGSATEGNLYGIPLTVSIEPRDAAGRIDFLAEGIDPRSGHTLVSRHAILSFDRGHSRVWRTSLTRACAPDAVPQVLCPSGQDCEGGVCVDQQVDPTRLPDVGTDAGSDSGHPLDAGSDTGCMGCTPDSATPDAGSHNAPRSIPCGSGLVRLAMPSTDWQPSFDGRPAGTFSRYYDHFAIGGTILQSVAFTTDGTTSWLGPRTTVSTWDSNSQAASSARGDTQAMIGEYLMRLELTAWTGGLLWSEFFANPTPGGISSGLRAVADFATWRTSVPSSMRPSSIAYAYSSGALSVSGVFLTSAADSRDSACTRPDALLALATAENAAGRPLFWIDAYNDGSAMCVSVISQARAVTGVAFVLASTLDELASEVEARCVAGSVPDVFTSWEQGGEIETFVQFVDAP